MYFFFFFTIFIPDFILRDRKTIFKLLLKVALHTLRKVLSTLFCILAITDACLDVIDSWKKLHYSFNLVAGDTHFVANDE